MNIFPQDFREGISIDKLIKQFPTHFVLGGSQQQTVPPSIPIADLFTDGNFPEGEILDHPIAANEYVIFGHTLHQSKHLYI